MTEYVKAMNKWEMKPERVPKFIELQALMEENKHENQYTCYSVELMV